MGRAYVQGVGSTRDALNGGTHGAIVGRFGTWRGRSSIDPEREKMEPIDEAARNVRSGKRQLSVASSLAT